MKLSRSAAFAFLVALTGFVSACRPEAPARTGKLLHPSPRSNEMIELDDEPRRAGWVEYDRRWYGTSFGAYLAPQADFADETGGVDLIFHFHGGQLAEREWRATGINALIVSAAFGVGSNVYATAFADPNRFGSMVDEVIHSLEKESGAQNLHARRIGLVSWSAGYGSIGKILAIPKYFNRVDTVVLLDSLHTGYTPDHQVEVDALENFIHFAREASTGKKLLVMSHSAIVPPDYASTTETTAAVLDAIGATRVDMHEKRNARGMRQLYEVNEGDLHARGFSGGGTQDHMDHLYVLEDLVELYVVPRWAGSYVVPSDLAQESPKPAEPAKTPDKKRGAKRR